MPVPRLDAPVSALDSDPPPEAAARASSPAARPATRTSVRKIAGAFVAFAIVDLVVAAPFPGPGSLLAALLPSLDALALWAWVAYAARRARPLSRAALAAMVTLALAIRVLRFADGVGVRYFNREVSFYVDLRLLPELSRLLVTTVPPAPLLGGLAAALIVVVALALALRWSFRTASPVLAQPRGRRGLIVAAAVVALTAVASPRFRDQALARAAGPRVAHEAAVFATRDRLWRGPAEDAARLASRLAGSPHAMEKLRGADVFLFVVESYGRTALAADEPDNAVAASLARADGVLARAGFTAASRWLDSPTYAGRSWLAQSTLATGVRSEDSLAFSYLQQLRPPITLPRLFHDVGYRTVLVQPGTTTPDPPRWLYGFDQILSAWDLGYAGRAFGWARIPDQHTIDVVHRRVVAPPHTAPLFVELTLVSSHAPWALQPPLVDNWDSLGDGRIYDRLDPVRFPLTWLTLSRGRPAYLRSIAYDLDVVFRYVVDRAPPGALFLIVGDHQPVAEITGGSASSAVPVHAFSRDPALVRALVGAGFQRGLRPPQDAPVAGLETLLETLAMGLSTARGENATSTSTLAPKPTPALSTHASTASDPRVDW